MVWEQDSETEKLYHRKILDKVPTSELTDEEALEKFMAENE